jgi:uncharacterized protein
LAAGGGALLGTFGLGTYAFGFEPRLRLLATGYQLAPQGWPAGLRLKICALADIHATHPDMSVERIAEIVRATNALNPDIVVLLGDYVRTHLYGWTVPMKEWASALSDLRAPLGVHAILGNHDWWVDRDVQVTGRGFPAAGVALQAAGISVYHNEVLRLTKNDQPFWIAGLADQLALYPVPGSGRDDLVGFDDLNGTLAKITDDAPVILLAHEPDLFPAVPARVSLTLSGHTHGGQVRVLGYSPFTNSRFGNRYAYGHVEEDGRHLIVSGGLGCSGVPMRFGVPPEIVVVEMGTSI